MLAFASLAASPAGAAASLAHCSEVVIGGGWSGVYFAYRRLDEKGYDASKLCILEASQRIGGRTYSVRDVLDVCAAHHAACRSLPLACPACRAAHFDPLKNTNNAELTTTQYCVCSQLAARTANRFPRRLTTTRSDTHYGAYRASPEISTYLWRRG